MTPAAIASGTPYARQKTTKPAARGALDPGDTFAAQWREIVKLFGGADAAYAPLSESEITSRAGRDVSSIIDPLVQRTTDRLTQQAQQGRESISGAYGDLADSYKDVPGRMRADFGQAEGDLAASSGALGEFLAGRGASAFSDLSGKLSAAGLPTDPAAGVQTLGAGVAGEAAGRGFSSLQGVIGERAASLGYADKLPALAGMQGAEALRTHERGNKELLESLLSDISSQIPGLTSDVVRGYRGDELTKANARTGRQGDLSRLGSSFLENYLNRDSAERIADTGQQQNRDELDQRKYEFDTTVTDDRATSHQELVTARDDVLDKMRLDGAALAERLAAPTDEDREVPIIVAGVDTGKTKKTKVKVAGKPYEKIFQQIYTLYAPTLRRYGISPTKITEYVHEALAGAGLTRPGGGAADVPTSERGGPAVASGR